MKLEEKSYTPFCENFVEIKKILSSLILKLRTDD